MEKLIDARLLDSSYAVPVAKSSSVFELLQLKWGIPSSDQLTFDFPPKWILPEAEGKLFVREEYQLVETSIRDRLERHPKSGAVILGNPGSGKSTFLHYMLHRELAQQRSVILHESQGTHVFTANQVFFLDKSIPDNFFDAECYTGVLALLDSAEQDSEPPIKFVAPRASCFPVLATSPKMGRYKVWSSKRTAALLVMNPFTAEESERLIQLYTTPSQFHAKRPALASVFNNFGPDFRHQLRFLLDGQAYIERHNHAIKTAIDHLTTEQARQLIAGSSDACLVSHILIATFRSIKGFMQHQVASVYILKRLLHRVTMYDLAERRHLFDLFHSSTGLSVSLGRMFEHLTHDLLAKGLQISLQPYSLFDPDCKLVTETFSLKSRTLTFYAKNLNLSETSDERCYYTPSEGNNPTFDSFVITRTENETLGIAFQMTVGRTHTLKKSGLKILLDRFKGAGVTRRIFVFVTPPARVLKIEAPTVYYKKQFEWRRLEVDFSRDHQKLALDFASYENDMEEGVRREEDEDDEDNDDFDIEMGME